MRYKDETGNVYGTLTVLEFAGSTKHVKSRAAYWKCRCECGEETIVEGAGLRKGHYKSCGCLQYSVRAYGGIVCKLLDGHPLRESWKSMCQRCKYRGFPGFYRYGGRGIEISKAWIDFREFFADMAPSWTPDKSLGRIDNDGDYCTENCRWETREEQSNNKSTNIFVSTPGGKMTIAQAGRKYGIGKSTIYARYRRGDREDALIRSVD